MVGLESLLPRLPRLPDPLGSLGLNLPRLATRQRQTIPDLTPEEERSLLKSLGSTAISGLERLGRFLGKPGAAVRGVLAGEPKHLLELLPFSQTLGLTDPKEWISGRQLLERWGMLGPNRPGLDWGDVAGFGAEVLLDPLSYATFGQGGALSAGGEIVKRAGLMKHVQKIASALKGGAKVGPRVARMTVTLGDMLRLGPAGTAEALEAARLGMKMSPAAFQAALTKPLGGLLGVSAFPMGRARAVLGQAGGVGEKIARGLDVAGEAIRYSLPGKHAVSLLDKKMKGATPEFVQRRMGPLAESERMADVAGRGVELRVARMMDQAGIPRGDVASVRALIAARELGRPLPPHMVAQGADQVVDALRQVMDDTLKMDEAAGLATRDLDDATAYLTRERHVFESPTRMTAAGPKPVSRRAIPTSHPFATKRETALRGWMGGTDFLNDVSLDPAFSARLLRGKRSMARRVAALQAKYGAQLQKAKPKSQWANPLVPEYRAASAAEIKSLARWAAELDPQHVQTGIPAWSTDVAHLAGMRFAASQRAAAGAETFYEMLASQAAPLRNVPGGVSVRKVLRHARLTGANAPQKAIDAILKQHPGWAPKLTGPKALGKLFVPKEIADHIGRVMRTFTVPEEIGKIGQMWDALSTWWRAHVTVYWPSYLTRNYTGGQIHNALQVAPHKALHGMMTADRFVRGQGIDDVLSIPYIKARGITNPKVAYETLQDLYYMHDVSGALGTDILGMGPTATRGAPHLMQRVPGETPFAGVARTVARGVPRAGRMNPLDVETFAPIMAGREMNLYIESLNRGGLWFALMRDGWDPAAAAAKVRLAHVDYSNLSTFERTVLKRVLPFYSFARGQAEFLAKELATRPGGPVAQTIRAANVAREGRQFMPDYLAQTMAIGIPEGTPLIGPKPGGDPRFIGGAGLMFEDPLQFLGGGPGPGGLLRGFIQELGSRAHPLVKGPFEYGTGYSFFQAGPRGGRLLEDMDPTIGRTLANIRDIAAGAEPGRTDPIRFPGSELVEHMAMQIMPRPFTTARTLTDPRKGAVGKAVNLLTGARVYDLPMRTQETLIGEAVQQELRGTGLARTFERTFIPREALERLSPLERVEAEKGLAMLRLLGKRAGQRARGEQLQPLRTW